MLKKTLNFIVKLIMLISLISILSSYINLGFLSILLSVSIPLIFIINSVLFLFFIKNKKYFYCIVPIGLLLNFSLPFCISIKNSSQLENSINLLSYNVRAFNSDNDIKEKNIPDKILKFINLKNADILCLQESSYKESKNIDNYAYKFLGYRSNKKKHY